jgi:hypothetical protein
MGIQLKWIDSFVNFTPAHWIPLEKCPPLDHAVAA